MTEPTNDNITAAINSINARLDLLSAQVLQLAGMHGQMTERAQVNQRELVNYVTTKMDELSQGFSLVSTQVSQIAEGAHDHREDSTTDETPTVRNGNPSKMDVLGI